MLIVIDTTLSLMCCIHVCAVSCCCFVCCCCLLFVSLSVCLFWPVRKVSRVSSIIPSSWNKVFSSSKMSPRKVGILRCFSPLSPFSPHSLASWAGTDLASLLLSVPQGRERHTRKDTTNEVHTSRPSRLRKTLNMNLKIAFSSSPVLPLRLRVLTVLHFLQGHK